MKFKKKAGIISLASFMLFGTILPESLNKKPEVYFVGIRPNNEKRYIANFSLAYQVLREKKILKNTYILTEDGKNDSYHSVDDIASIEAFSLLMANLSKKIRKEDKFIFYLNSHGLAEPINLRDGKKNKINLSKFYFKRNKGINELELETYLSSINAKEKIFLFDCCYSGGFAKRFGKENTIAISSTKSPEEAGYSSLVNSFSGKFFKAFKENSGADKDSDGKISILEAFNFAKEHHNASREKRQSPQIFYDKEKINPNKVGLN